MRKRSDCHFFSLVLLVGHIQVRYANSTKPASVYRLAGEAWRQRRPSTSAEPLYRTAQLYVASHRGASPRESPRESRERVVPFVVPVFLVFFRWPSFPDGLGARSARSEERRVGKECRS